MDVFLYDRLFKVEDPEGSVPEGGSFLDNLNPDSLRVVQGYGEPALAEAQVEERFQFERKGYFCMDKSSQPGRPVFNRTTTLRDTWGKMAEKEG
jgi:glutaminyl-tRNA synthetase